MENRFEVHRVIDKSPDCHTPHITNRRGRYNTIDEARKAALEDPSGELKMIYDRQAKEWLDMLASGYVDAGDLGSSTFEDCIPDGDTTIINPRGKRIE